MSDNVGLGRMVDGKSDGRQGGEKLRTPEEKYKYFVDSYRREMKILAAYDIAEMRRVMDNPVVQNFIDQGFDKYTVALASSALSLGIVGRDINSAGVERLLKASHIKKDKTVFIFLALIDLLKRRSHHPYIFAVNSLLFLKKEPGVAEVLRLVMALGADAPDANIAGTVIDFCKITDLEIDYSRSFEKDAKGAPIFNRFKEMISRVYDIIAEFTIKQIDEIVKNRHGGDGITDAFYPYIWALANLASAGKEVDRGSIENFLIQAEVRVEKTLLDDAVSLRFKNHLTYLASLSYLGELGVEQSLDNLLSVVKALEIQPDAKIAQEAMDYYNSVRNDAKT